MVGVELFAGVCPNNYPSGVDKLTTILRDDPPVVITKVEGRPFHEWTAVLESGAALTWLIGSQGQVIVHKGAQ